MRLALPKFGDVNRSIFCRGGDRAEYSTAPTSPASLLFVVVVDIFFTGLIVLRIVAVVLNDDLGRDDRRIFSAATVRVAVTAIAVVIVVLLRTVRVARVTWSRVFG